MYVQCDIIYLEQNITLFIGGKVALEVKEMYLGRRAGMRLVISCDGITVSYLIPNEGPPQRGRVEGAKSWFNIPLGVRTAITEVVKERRLRKRDAKRSASYSPGDSHD